MSRESIARSVNDGDDGGLSSDLSSNGLTISWKQLNYSVGGGCCGTKKQLIHDSWGVVKPGESLAIMGPSGSGKTTLLNLLADRISSGCIQGEIFADGKPRGKDFRWRAFYVEQENIFLEIFTVRETLDYHVNIAQPSLSREEKRKRVDSVLTELGLYSCQDAIVGGFEIKGLSSGQLKRLALALSLISDPGLLLLDEPTSKIDSAAAFNIVKTVKQLTDKGKTVIFSIHQPSSEIFAQFDKLVVMAGGFTAFFGPASSVTSYFENQGHSFPKFSNPIDHLGLLVNKDFKGSDAVDEIVDRYAESSEREAIMKEVDDVKPPEEDPESSPAKTSTMSRASFPVQVFHLTSRYTAYYVKNPKMFPSFISSNLMSSIMMWGLCFRYENKKEIPDFVLLAIMFMIVTTVPSQAIGAALQLFQAMRPTFLRERSNGLIDVAPFWLSLTLVAVPFLAINGFMIAFFFYWTLDWNNVIWLGILLSAAIIASESLWRLVSMFFASETTVLGSCMCLFILQLLACGFLVKKSNMKFPFNYAYHGSLYRYAFGGILVNEFRDRNASDPNAAVASTSLQVATNGTSVIEDYDLEGESRMDDLIYLCGFFGAFELGNLICLFLFHNGKQ